MESEIGHEAAKLHKLEKKLDQAISSRDVGRLRKYLSANLDDSASIDRAIAVAQVAISVAGLWMK